jgi:hypothetical protein
LADSLVNPVLMEREQLGTLSHAELFDVSAGPQICRRLDYDAAFVCETRGQNLGMGSGRDNGLAADREPGAEHLELPG